MSKKIVISGYYGFGNFGDEAILYTLIQKLKDYDTDITVISGNPQFTIANYYVKAIKNFALFKLIYTIKSADVLISGGGSLLQDVTSVRSLIYYLLVIWLGILFNKKVIIFAQGIGPIKNKFAFFITMSILKKCTFISVRDINSQNLLKNEGINSELVCDPIYSFPLKKSESANTVGIQLRSFKNLSEELLNNLANQIAKVFSDRKCEILSFQDSIDLDICNIFAEKIKKINPNVDVEVISGLSGKDLVEKLSSLEYLIGMRFHALLLAMKFGIKSIVINYDIKVEKLAKEYNLPILPLSGSADFETAFNAMQQEDSNELINKANSNIFNWDSFIKIIKNSI